VLLTMSNNRQFAMRREWVNYLAQISEEDEPDAVLEINTDDGWFIFKNKRPVTTHLLEELFGPEDAKYHARLIHEDFTEAKAVEIVAYVYNTPKKYKRPKKDARIRQFNSVRRKE